MDRIDSVAAFVEVAERRSFTGAARRLGRSPAAVTRAIGELEARLGVRLLNRTTRAVSLTEAGERFLAGARRVLADLEEIERAAAGEGTAPRGELRMTAPILFGRLHVLPIVTEFLGRFADVSVALSLIDRPVDLVEEGLDVAVRIGPLAESSAVAIRVGAVRRIVVASPDYMTQHGTPQVPADLAAHVVVAFSATRLPTILPAVHCFDCSRRMKATNCRSISSIRVDGIRRRNCALFSISPGLACAAA